MSPEYHAWTHRPKALGGTDPIEQATGSEIVAVRALHRETGGLVVPNATETPIWFATYETEDPDELVFETFEGTAGDAGKLQSVAFRAQGVYSITVTIHWEAEFTQGTTISLVDESVTSSNWPFGEAPNMSAFGTGEVIDTFTYPFTMTVLRKYPLYTMTTGDITSGRYGMVRVKVRQFSGSNKDLAWAALDIFYLGATTTSI